MTTTTISITDTCTPMRYTYGALVKTEEQSAFTPSYNVSRPTSAQGDAKSSHSASSVHSHSQHSGTTSVSISDQHQRNLNGAPRYDSLEDRFPFLKDDRKRTRKLLTPAQTRILEAIWERTIYPSTSLREAVACQLGIGPRKVQIWFQNKRQGRRRHVRSPEGGQFVAFAGGEARRQAASTAIYRPRDVSSHVQDTIVQSSRDQCMEMQAAADDLRLAELRDEHGRPFAELDAPTASYATMDSQQVQRRHYVAQPFTAQQGNHVQRHARHLLEPHWAMRAEGQHMQARDEAAVAGSWPRASAAPTIMYTAASGPSSLMHRRMQSNGKHGEQLQYLITPTMRRVASHADAHTSSPGSRQPQSSPSTRPYYPLASPRSADPTGWRSFCASHAAASPSAISPRQVGYPPPSPNGHVERNSRLSRGRDKQTIMLPPLTPLSTSPSRHSAGAGLERLSLTPTRAQSGSPANRETLPSISELVSSRR